MDASTIVATSATVIAVVSLVVSVSEARATRRHNRLSVRPLLEMQHRWIEGQKSGLRLINYGVGPATVVSSLLTVDGTPIGEFNQANTVDLRGSLGVSPVLVSLSRPRFLGTDYSEYLLSVDDYDPEVHADFQELVGRRMRLEINYESLYGGESYRTVFPRTPAIPDIDDLSGTLPQAIPPQQTQREES